MNFKKMNRNYLQCLFGCLNNEDQEHSFVHCTPIVSRVQYAHIFGTLDEQICIMKTFGLALNADTHSA